MQSNGQYCAGNPSTTPASHQPHVYCTFPPPDRQVPEETQPSATQVEPVGIVNDSQIPPTVGPTLTTATSLESLPTLPATASEVNAVHQLVHPVTPTPLNPGINSPSAPVVVKGEVPPVPLPKITEKVILSSSAAAAGTEPPTPTVAESGMDDSVSQAPEASTGKDATYYRPCLIKHATDVHHLISKFNRIYVLLCQALQVLQA